MNVLSQFLVSNLPTPEVNIWHLAAKCCTVVDKLVANFVRSLFGAGQTANMVFTRVFPRVESKFMSAVRVNQAVKWWV